MLSMNELLGNKYQFDNLPAEHQANLNTLLYKVNEIRAAWNKPMTVTSGYRSADDQMRIYKEKADKKGVAFDESKVPMRSKHLIGAAVDIYDPNQELQAWCKNNEALLNSIGVWCEDFSTTTNWVHFQCQPYASWHSGKSLWFMP